jgi:hypothetical protein
MACVKVTIGHNTFRIGSKTVPEMEQRTTKAEEITAKVIESLIQKALLTLWQQYSESRD